MNTLPHSVPVIVEHECQTLQNNWQVPQLVQGEIHVWRQYLDLDSASVEAFKTLLSKDEQNRAQRFRFEDGRREFIVSRGTLRVLLGAHLGAPPDRLQFAYSDYGRPKLLEDDCSEPVEFNVSHSARWTLLAFTRLHRIGIDVEEIRRDFDIMEIAKNFFSQSELSALRQLPVQMRHEAFFRCWTRKEAFIKALGEGLSHPLDAFDVSLAPAEPPALLATRPDSHEAAGWTLRDLIVPAGYLAALAIETKSSSG